VALSATSLNLRLATLLPLIAELEIVDCDLAPSTLPECVVSIPELRVLKWSKFDFEDISSTTLATCRAAFAHPARAADLVFKVELYLMLEEDELDELYAEVQGLRDEWQAERARLQAAGVGGSREFELEIEVHVE